MVSLVLIASAQPASAAVCDLATNCAIPSAAASCRAFATLSTDPSNEGIGSEAHVMTPPGNVSEGNHAWRADPGLTFPSVNGHLGAVESFCQSFTDAGGVRRACGRAVIEDLFLDLNPVVRATLTLWGGTSYGCSSLGPRGVEVFNQAHIERLIVSIGNGVTTFDIAAHDPNFSIMLGPGTRLIVNEQNPMPGICPSSTGSLLHLQTPDGDLILGWVSTSACL